MDFSPSYQNGFNFLKKYGNHLTLIRKIRLMLHLAGGLRFLKSKGIVHMDLTLANILISPGDYKPRIIDFGESYSEVIKDIGKIYDICRLFTRFHKSIRSPRSSFKKKDF